MPETRRPLFRRHPCRRDAVAEEARTKQVAPRCPVSGRSRDLYERAYERDPIHEPGHLGQKLANTNSRHAGRNRLEGSARRRARLGAPCFQLARSAGQPKKDDVFLLLANFTGRKAIERRPEAREAHAQRRGNAPLQEETAVDPMFRRAAERFSCIRHDKPRRRSMVEAEFRRGQKRPGKILQRRQAVRVMPR